MEQEKVSALVEENMKTIFAYALSRVSHKEDAEDLAGDIILSILSSAQKIRDDNAFFGYIWAIAANTYKKYLYKKSRIHYEELDEEYMEEFFRMAEKSAVPEVGNILRNGTKKLPDLRKLQFIGSGLEDNLLLWDFLFEMICRGWELFRCRLEEEFRKKGLYKGGDIFFGSTYELGKDHPYKTDSFAGYCGIHSGYAASYADYGILPVQNRYTSYGEKIADSLEDVLNGNAVALVPVISKEQREAIKTIYGEEIASFAKLFELLYDCAVSVMRVHAPGSVEQIIGPVLAKVLLFHTVGMIGAFAVRSGALMIPEADCPLGGFLYQ